MPRQCFEKQDEWEVCNNETTVSIAIRKGVVVATEIPDYSNSYLKGRHNRDLNHLNSRHYHLPTLEQAFLCDGQFCSWYALLQ